MSLKPFHRCTHTAHAPNGDFYVSDGYGNACVHKYSPDGKHLLSWGEPGTAPGQFNLPHNICCDADGWVYVADRESHRVQIFDGNGRYEAQWNNLHRPSALFMPPSVCPICYIGECGPTMSVNRKTPNLGPRVSIVSNKGELLARLGGLHAGNEPGGSSSRRTASPSTRRATSTSGRSRAPPGRSSTPTCPCPTRSIPSPS